MSRELSDVVNECLSKDQEIRKAALYEMGDALFGAIEKSLENKRSINYAGRRYRIIRNGVDKSGKEKWVVSLYGSEKDFDEALNALFEKLFEGLKRAVYEHQRHPDSIQPLVTCNLKPSGKNILAALRKPNPQKFIINSFGQVLNNEVFNEEINAYKRKQRMAMKSFKKEIENKSIQDIFNILIGQDEIQKNFEEIEIILFSICCKYSEDIDIQNPDIWLENQNSNEIKEHTQALNINTTENELPPNKTFNLQALKNQVIAIYGPSIHDVPLEGLSSEDPDLQDQSIDKALYAESLFSFSYQLGRLSRYDLQRKHFFWKPNDDSVWKEAIEDIYNMDELVKLFGRPNKEVSIQFFCAWLMACSGISPQQMSDVFNVDLSTVYRWRHLNMLLKYPFVEEDIFPVFFGSKLRRQINTRRNRLIEEQKEKLKDTLFKVYTCFRDIALEYIDEINLNKEINTKVPDTNCQFRVCYNHQIKEIKTTSTDRRILFAMVDL